MDRVDRTNTPNHLRDTSDSEQSILDIDIDIVVLFTAVLLPYGVGVTWRKNLESGTGTRGGEEEEAPPRLQ
jgi:hypothetical protein